jgi:hypothetical protein
MHNFTSVWSNVNIKEFTFLEFKDIKKSFEFFTRSQSRNYMSSVVNRCEITTFKK